MTLGSGFLLPLSYRTTLTLPRCVPDTAPSWFFSYCIIAVMLFSRFTGSFSFNLPLGSSKFPNVWTLSWMLLHLLFGFSYHQNLMALNLNLLTLITFFFAVQTKVSWTVLQRVPHKLKSLYFLNQTHYLHFQACCWWPPPQPQTPNPHLSNGIIAHLTPQIRNLFFDSHSSFTA